VDTGTARSVSARGLVVRFVQAELRLRQETLSDFGDADAPGGTV
jgi:hypothetical protein